MPSEIEVPFNAFRVCEALAKIGYTPSSAICDIVDNSVESKASLIRVLLKRKEGLSLGRRNNAEEYVIIDNGIGMNEEQLTNALTIGASEEGYGQESLSKFGLGLKSASLSQGNRVEIVSFNENSSPNKYILDLSTIQKAGKYVVIKDSIDDSDKELIDEFLESEKSGTIVRIKNIHEINHPSVKATEEDLKRTLGVIYYYFLTKEDPPLEMYLNDDKVVPYDPLFTSEIGEDGNLNEHNWDGKSVKWIQQPMDLTVDAERQVSVKIEATQLPHPPTFDDQRKAVRDKYNIAAGQYGYYVYRNNRLISWAEKFDGIVPLDQDFYSFRGRILINTDADDILNIDVKKSRVLLSEEAREALGEITHEFKKKSKKAWEHRSSELEKLAQQDPISESIKVIDNIKFPESLPGEKDDSKTAEEKVSREEKEEKKKPITSQEKSKTEGTGQRVFMVSHLDESVLWERAHDASVGTIVRINENHIFIREVYAACMEDHKTITILNTLLYCLACAEGYAVKSIHKYSQEDLDEIFFDFRRIASSYIYKATKDALAQAFEEE